MGNSQDKEAPEAQPQPNPLAIDEESPYVKRILEAREQLTGMERVKLIFKRDEMGSVSPEIQRVVHAGLFSVVVGGLIGALGRGRIVHMDFIKSHTHEIFETPLEAKRKLQDKVTLGMGAGAYRIGWRLTLFTTIYVGVSTIVSTYRGKMGILDQVIGAGTAGFIYKLPQGPKAQIAGTVVGSLLGVTAGVLTLGITKLTGETIDKANLRYYQIIAKKQKEDADAARAAADKVREIDRPIGVLSSEVAEFGRLAKFHDNLIAALEEKRTEEEEGVSTDNNINNPATGKSNITEKEPGTHESSDSTTNKIELTNKSSNNSSNSNSSSTQQINSSASG